MERMSAKTVSRRRGIVMPKNRDKQRANRRLEEPLSWKTEFGIRDTTPPEAIRNIRQEQIEERRKAFANR